MKKTIIMMLLALVAMCASAETYSYLRFTYTDGSEVAYSVDGIVVTYDGTNIYVNNADGSATMALSDVTNMYFSNDGTSTEVDTYLRGDADGNGEVKMPDLTMLIDYILNGSAEGINLKNADCNVEGGDGIWDLQDVNALIDYLLNNEWSD